MIRAVVFDFDGVFIDTERLKTLSYFEVLSDPEGPYAETFVCPQDEYMSLHPVGKGRGDVCKWIIERFGLDKEAQRRADEIEQACRSGRYAPGSPEADAFEDNRNGYDPGGMWTAWKAVAFDRGIRYEAMKKDAPAIPEASELLHALKARGLPVGLVTRTDGSTTREHLRRIDLGEEFFDAMVCEGDADVAGQGKERFYQVAVAKMGVSPGESAAIEDTDTGVASAQEAGMGLIVAAPTALTRKQNFLGNGAHLVVPSLDVLIPQTPAEWLAANAPTA